MDPSQQIEGESDADLFLRIEKETRVGHYFLVLPAGGKVLGTIFEGGMLTRDFQWGAHPRVTLFMHAQTVQPLPEGRYKFVEKGRRTRYLESLAVLAHDVVFWERVATLRHAVLQRARPIWADLWTG